MSTGSDEEGRPPAGGGEPPRYDTEPLPVLGRSLPPPPPGVARVVPRGRFRRRKRDVDAQTSEALEDAVRLTAEGEPVPSPLVHSYLFASERFVGEWHRHWMYLWKEATAVVATTFLLGYVSGVTGASSGAFVGVVVVLWAVVLGWALWRLGDWWFDRFVITSKRIMVITGMIRRRVAMMPLSRVTDMLYDQSPLGRVLDYGTFIVESAGQDQALREVRFLPDPRELYLLMNEEMYGGEEPEKPRKRRRRLQRQEEFSGDA